MNMKGYSSSFIMRQDSKHPISLDSLGRLSPFEAGMCFAHWIKQELEENQAFGNWELARLEKYYSKFANCYRYAQRVKPLVAAVEPGKRVLDVGCGLGSESILCGLLGAQVTGIDLNKERLDIAPQRLDYYQRQSNFKIEVNFSLENILKHRSQYDLIWSKESISHIDPVDEFLEVSYQNLRSGGKLVISDSHALNPYAWLEAVKARRRLSKADFVRRDPQTGECISYAQERLFSVLKMKRMLLVHGFKVWGLYLDIFLPSIFTTKYTIRVVRSAEGILSRLPIIKLLSGAYTIVGLKG